VAFHPLQSLAKRVVRLRKKPVTIERLGAMWELHPKDWIDNRLLIGREFETEQLAFVEKLIRDRELGLFFDCGSNIGLYSVLLGTRCPGLIIHSFEPVKSTHARLTKNIELNTLLVRTTAHNYGLGARPNKMTIAINPKSSGTATVDSKEQANPKRKFTASEDIEIRVFDSEFSETGQKAFFKIDVEGHELDALKGMIKYLSQHDCTLQIEAWDDNQTKLTEFMASQNYREFHRIDSDLYFEKIDH